MKRLFLFFIFLSTISSKSAFALNIPGNLTETEVRSFNDTFSTTDRRPLLAHFSIVKSASYVNTNVYVQARIRCTDNSTTTQYDSNPFERWLPGTAGYSSLEASLSWVFNVASPRPDTSGAGTAATYTCKLFVKAYPYTGSTANTVVTITSKSGLRMLANTSGAVHGDGGAGTAPSNSCSGTSNYIWNRLNNSNGTSVSLWDISGDSVNSQSLFTPDSAARSVAIYSNITMRSCSSTTNAFSVLYIRYEDGSGNRCYDSLGSIIPQVNSETYALNLGTHANPGVYPSYGTLSNSLADDAFTDPGYHSVPVLTCYSSSGTNLGTASIKAYVSAGILSGQDAEIFDFNYSGIDFYNEF